MNKKQARQTHNVGKYRAKFIDGPAGGNELFTFGKCLKYSFIEGYNYNRKPNTNEFYFDAKNSKPWTPIKKSVKQLHTTHNVLNRIIEKMRSEITNYERKHQGEKLGSRVDNDRVFFEMYLDSSIAIVEDVSQPYDPGWRNLKHFDTINDFINWLEE